MIPHLQHGRIRSSILERRPALAETTVQASPASKQEIRLAIDLFEILEEVARERHSAAILISNPEKHGIREKNAFPEAQRTKAAQRIADARACST
jgi:hypothetical protein